MIGPTSVRKRPFWEALSNFYSADLLQDFNAKLISNAVFNRPYNPTRRPQCRDY
jgi:hypothetical protein